MNFLSLMWVCLKIEGTPKVQWLHFPIKIDRTWGISMSRQPNVFDVDGLTVSWCISNQALALFQEIQDQTGEAQTMLLLAEVRIPEAADSSGVVDLENSAAMAAMVPDQSTKCIIACNIFSDFHAYIFI